MSSKAVEQKVATIERNLYSESWTGLTWNSSDVLASLDGVRKLVESDIEKAISWYYEKKRKKVWYSQGLRMLAVIFGSIGAAIPFISSTGLGTAATGAAAELAILRTNQWGYVFILAATACVAVDKIFGFSTNWIRFVDAATKMQTLLGRFRLEWYKQLALADLTGQGPESIAKLFDILLDFANRSREVIERETGDWIAEFRSNLTKLSEDTKASQEAREKQLQGHAELMRQSAQERDHRSGSITVTIKNFAKLGAGFTWLLEVDNETRKVRIDRPVFILKGLEPGTYLVAASGTTQSGTVQDSKTARVESGKPTPLELDLL